MDLRLTFCGNEQKTWKRHRKFSGAKSRGGWGDTTWRKWYKLLRTFNSEEFMVVWKYKVNLTIILVMRWCSWLGHCTTNRQVVGLISGGVIGLFHWHKPSNRTMTLVSTQPLTKNKCSADNIATLMRQMSKNSGIFKFLDS